MAKFLRKTLLSAQQERLKVILNLANNLRTENGADIDGYIKKTNSSKSKLTGDFLFKKKDKKETTRYRRKTRSS